MHSDLSPSIPERLAAIEDDLAAVKGDQADSYRELIGVEGHQYQLAARFLDALITSQADPQVLIAFGTAFQETFHPEPESWAVDSSL